MQLIGIYIDKAKPYVKKSLNEKWYPFGNFSSINKELFENHPETNIAEELRTLVIENQDFINDLYELKNTPNIKINLNCIVGKNGSGKSTILDIVYRILNNFGVMIKGIYRNLNQDYEPIWASGLNARLYFEASTCSSKKNIICIKIDGNIDKVYDYDTAPAHVKVFKDGIPINPSINTPQNLFDYIPYTIATNYSFYTGKDDNSNDLKWINTLYNKNDGYITPIVFAPYKNKNNINIEKENYIGKERVMYLSLLMQSISNNNHFLEKYIPFKIQYNLKTYEHYKTNKPEKAFDYFHFLLNKLQSDYQDNLLFTNFKKKLRRLLSSPKEDKEDAEKEKFSKKVAKQIFFLYLHTQKKWKNKLYPKDESSIFNNYVLPYLAYKTIKICLQYENFKSLFPSRKLYESYLKNRKNTELIIDNVIDILNPYIDNNGKKQSFFILEKRDHINLKIYQCIRFYENYKDMKFEELKSISFYSTDFLSEIKNKICKTNQNFTNLTYDDIVEYSFPSFFEKNIYYKPVNDYTPNEIYNSDNTKSKILLTQMSSGEQHLYFSLSYAIYHIKNIESVKEDGKRIKYKNINLIFDEAELYYHPEFQKNFIQNLLTVLSNSNLNPELINSINVTIITHSPYLISDIPNSNILALENGYVKNETEKTFCANYYDLLKNQFFLSSTIGGIAQENINKIIEAYEIAKKNREKNQVLTLEEKQLLKEYKNKSAFYNQIINSIGDEYLSKILIQQHEYVIEKNCLYEEACNKLKQMNLNELKSFLGKNADE